MSSEYIEVLMATAKERISGLVFTELNDFEEIQTFEAERFARIRKNPESIFEIEHADVLMSDQALALLFRCGGQAWLECVYEFLSTIDEGSVPIRFNNTLHEYKPLQELVLNEELAIMVIHDFLWVESIISEEESLERILEMFCVQKDKKRSIFSPNAIQFVEKLLNEPYTETENEFAFQYHIKVDESARSVTISADHIQEDVTVTY